MVSELGATPSRSVVCNHAVYNAKNRLWPFTKLSSPQSRTVPAPEELCLRWYVSGGHEGPLFAGFRVPVSGNLFGPGKLLESTCAPAVLASTRTAIDGCPRTDRQRYSGRNVVPLPHHGDRYAPSRIGPIFYTPSLSHRRQISHSRTDEADTNDR